MIKSKENKSKINSEKYQNYDPLSIEFECSNFFADDSLSDVDSDTDYLIKLEEERQARKLIFIASESIQPRPVREVLGSVFTNIYAEGYPSQRMNKTERHLLMDFDFQLTYHRRYWDKRYYKGADYADFAEALAQNRVAKLFATPEVPAENIFANVQPLSGAPANNAIYEAFVKPGDTVMGMALNNGGHLTHGSESNRSGKHYNIVSYTANAITGKLDYDHLKQLAEKYKPKMIIAGYSAYPWNIDWKKFREVADAAGDAILMADIAHTAGLVAGGQFNNPIGYADVIVFTTHKTFCGPRGAVILTTDEEKAQLIDSAVFPGEQGGPHLNNIAAKAVCFKLAMEKEFKDLQKKTVENAGYFAECLTKLGLKLAYGGTDSHLLLIDLKSLKSESGYPVTGEIATRILDLCGITCNKNTIAGDTNAAHPTAIRFGMTWVTQRGITKSELSKLAELVYKVLANIKPFNYLHTVDENGENEEIGRGKIDIDIFEEVQQEVEKIIRSINKRLPKFPSGYPHYYDFTNSKNSEKTTPLISLHEKNGAKLQIRSGWQMPVLFKGTDFELKHVRAKVGLMDSGDHGLIELTGDIDRVRPFLHEVSTNCIIDLEPGQGKRTILLDREGKFIDDVIIHHLPTPSTKNDFCRFIVTTHAHSTKKVLNWFRCLSDEYVIFDDDIDLYAKIQGPMIIHDLKENTDPKKLLTCLSLIGPNAAKVLKKLNSKFGSLLDHEIAELKLDGINVIISRLDYSKKDVCYYIFTHPNNAAKLWEAILKSGKTDGIEPVGFGVLDKIRIDANLPIKSTNKIVGSELYNSKLKDLFYLTKPYFIGKKKILAKIQQKQNNKEYVYNPKDLPLRQSCLYEEHKKLNGKMVPFAGWEMPVLYAGSSINDEHAAVRRTVGLFDVSHMGVFEFSGPYATRFLDILTTNYVPWLYPGQAQYSYLLDPNGRVIDDIFLYRVEKDRYMMIVNAANAEKDWAWINAVHSRKFIIDTEHPDIEMEGFVEIRNLKDPSSGKDQLIDLALQGPYALKVLQAMTTENKIQRKLANLQKGDFIDVKLKGIKVRIARTGYTGARIGFEMYLHPDDAPKFWKHLLKFGEEFGIVPTALGSRDSTRTEAGFPLYGNELAGDFNITPIDAGYGSFVKFHKPYFIGRKAMLDRTIKREMDIVRFKMDEKGVKVVKAHDPVASERGEFIGYITSSVSIEGYQMGLAYIKQKFNKIGAHLHIYPLPRRAGHDHGSHDIKGTDLKVESYQMGEKTVVPVTAKILPRFPQEGELEEEYIED